jgi:hypothetical protein
MADVEVGDGLVEPVGVFAAPEFAFVPVLFKACVLAGDVFVVDDQYQNPAAATMTTTRTTVQTISERFIFF